MNMLIFFPQINTLRNEKVENLNQMFTEVQRDVKSISKSTSVEPKKGQKVRFFFSFFFFATLKLQNMHKVL